MMMNMISIQWTNEDMCEPRPRFIQTRKVLQGVAELFLGAWR